MVFDTTVIEHITAYLASPLYLLLARLYLRLRLKALLHGAVVELTLQEKQSLGTVFRLVARLGILDEDFLFLACVGICIPITQTNTRLYLVDILTSGSTGAESIPRQLGWVYIYLNSLVDQRRNEDACKTGHTLALSIERRHTHQTMHTILALQITIGILIAFYRHGNTLDTCLIAFLHIGNGHFVAMSLSPAHIHTHQHGSPILALGTTGT